MNIFVLDENPKLAAQYHCDRHTCKMLVEHIQMMSTAIRLNGYDSDELYKTTHQNHPCSKWVRESRDNFLWLSELTYHLFEEYTTRYGKIHKSVPVFEECIDHIRFIPFGERTPFVYCGMDDTKCDTVVESYREYYRVHKSKFATWKTEVP